MSRTVQHDGKGTLQVRFAFHRGLVERIKTLPRRRWNAERRQWLVPESDVVLLVDLLADERFLFDAATRRLYEEWGGTRSLAAASAVEAPQVTGHLFGGLQGADPENSEASSLGSAANLTVSQLNLRVQALLEQAFPAPIWLVGEISGFNKSAHRRHVSFELVERDEQGHARSKIPATLFAGNREAIDRALSRAGDPFRIEDEILVRLLVRVELYVPWGQYRVVVEDLDIRYTLGEVARRREEILRRLAAQGLLDKNRLLPLPELPLRVGLITSLGSDAYNDVLRTLRDAGYAFHLTVHGARVQGRQTEPSVLNALDHFRRSADALDVVMICRGGGARTDLMGFDSEPLGRAVALFPLPVVVGIGHEQDRSVLDSVARSCKTPTAAAAMLVERVRESVQRVETLGAGVLAAAAVMLREEQRRGAERALRLARSAQSRLEAESRALTHARRRLLSGLRVVLSASRAALLRLSSLVPARASLHLAQQRLQVRGTLSAVVRAARWELEAERKRLAGWMTTIAPRSGRCLNRGREQLEARERRLRLVEPQRVLERGYAILRLRGGSVVTSADMAPQGSTLLARLRRGTLRLESRGEQPAEGG